MSTVYCRACGKQVDESATTCPACGARQHAVGEKNKVVASLLAMILGAFGIHRFYLGQWRGLLYLLFFWTLIPSLVSFIETFVFLFSDQRKWDLKYNAGLPSGSAGSAAVIIVIVVILYGGIFLLGVLAAIAIPAYQDYAARAQVTEGLSLAGYYRQALADHHTRARTFDGVQLSALGGQETGQYVDSISLEDPHEDSVTIVVTFKDTGVSSAIRGRSFPLGTLDGGGTWTCGYRVQEPMSVDYTLLDPKYLPSACR